MDTKRKPSKFPGFKMESSASEQGTMAGYYENHSKISYSIKGALDYLNYL
jgi:hypothetical protein